MKDKEIFNNIMWDFYRNMEQTCIDCVRSMREQIGDVDRTDPIYIDYQRFLYRVNSGIQYYEKQKRLLER